MSDLPNPPAPMPTPAEKPMTHTESEYQDLAKKAGEMASCLIWAVKFMRTSSGGGLVMHRDDAGNFASSESWMTWFRRALKEGAGVEFDDEVLTYSRASMKDRKQMLKQIPTLAAKLNR